MTRRLLLLLLLPALLPVSGVADTAPSKAQLEKLKSRISELSEAQSRELRERDSVQASLREAELRISRLTREQRNLEKKASTARQRLDGLEAEQAVLAAEKRTQLDWLGKTVRASYQAGRQERIKLLLNQEQPDQIARLLRYQEYYQRARSNRLKAVNGELDELKAIALRVEKARQVLLEKRTDVQRHADKLQDAQKERQATLASLNRSLDDRGSNLNQLKADQQRLQKLLADMQRSLNDIPADLGGKPFGNLAGKLPWPVEARISTGYNSRREGALRWQGVIFNAAPGTPVRAIHAGRVVFADWLRGYGLLTIVDHGNGYLTLYGYNQSLLREVGEWVSAGDSLALAGNSGGNRTNGLYFEIRHRGKAVNPTRWCNQRVTLPPLAQNR
ncbi:peptidoglycan DD-metalloendopeptidase family protein [Alcanivorax sp. VBW004]|uniref:murein hydrolase activator EnvC family protein n=1 Tax=Alcanivorax sp. VBW004 TaxID=1287708 RepID=UPI0012BBA830|nr:peptidoglycan DD-metalloendopeptidase family protein [Alcanivorax sp. VBW004]MTT51508.1 peptidoglycan DD-metalloendopeptidase family protein [Alcanivorax sp. VBW004]